MPLLEVEGICKSFGGLFANQDVSFTVGEGEVVGLIGPNGAGKTTLFSCITGFLRPDGGRVRLDGRDITGLTPEAICRLGVTRTFQVVQTMRQMTVLDNVMVGAFCRTASTAAARARAEQVLELGGLAAKARALAENLTMAERKRLEVLRCLATQPRVLMLDEAMAGLNPAERSAAMDLIRTLNRQGIAILLVEHVMDVVMPLSDKVVVLEQGRKIAEGPPAAMAHDPTVIRAYLGEKYRAHAN